MRYVIRSEIAMDIKPCVCGKYPKFIQPNSYYSDLWLECSCGRYTKNTGGFHYAEEISEADAKIAAIKLWNNGNVMEIYK